jgi:DNA-binding transcriptional MerR regulator
MLAEQQTYSISEAAEQLQVSTHYMRIAERLGAVPRARRTRSGWRYYTLEDIERLRRLGVGGRKRKLERSNA